MIMEKSNVSRKKRKKGERIKENGSMPKKQTSPAINIPNSFKYVPTCSILLMEKELTRGFQKTRSR